MRFFARWVVLLNTLLTVAMAHSADMYHYSYTFNFGPTVSGFFTGTANENLVTGLSDISAYLNGSPFNGNPHLSGDTNNLVLGGAVASFDGNQNNFLFIDHNPSVFLGFTNFFTMVHNPGSGGNGETNFAQVGDPIDPYATDSTCGMCGTFDYSPTRWSLKLASAVPEPTQTAFFLVGLLALASIRRNARQRTLRSLFRE